MISSLSSWVLSIAGIVLLSVVIELILPNGAMNKYIKSIFGFIIMLVILTPIPQLLNQNIDITSFFQSDTIKVDKDYIEQINFDKLLSIQNSLEDEISTCGYKNVKVYISSDIFDNTFTINSVTIDLRKLVITENAEHTNIMKIKQHITSIIKTHLKLEEDEIYYEE